MKDSAGGLYPGYSELARSLDPESKKIVRIASSEAFPTLRGGQKEVPDGMRHTPYSGLAEACVGLQITISTTDEVWSVNPDNLIESLRRQEPQEESPEATEWLGMYILSAEGITVAREGVEVLWP